jgi:hypothetical protein
LIKRGRSMMWVGAPTPPWFGSFVSIWGRARVFPFATDDEGGNQRR